MAEVIRPYPWFTWEVTVAASATIAVRANNVAENLTVPAGAYWGLATESGDTPHDDSLTEVIADAIATHTEINTCVGTYVWTGNGQPLHRYAITKTGNNADDAVLWGSAANISPATLGFNGGYDAINTGTSVTLTSDWNADGYWSPYVPTGWGNRDGYSEVLAEITMSPYDRSSTTHTVLNDSVTNQVRVYTFERVHKAHVEPRWATISNWATVASRDVDDPNNLLSRFLRAAMGGAEIRYYRAADTYDEVRLVDASLSSTQKLATGRPTDRFMTVIVPMSFEGENVP